METSTLFICFFAGLIPVYAYAAHRFYRELKQSHPTVWEQLGRPGLGVHLSFKQEGMGVLQLLGRKYANLGNRRLTFWGDLLRLCWFTMLVGMLLYVVLTDGKLGIKF